ncbi:MAG TPA: glycosyl hydrolase 108 family protein [Allosphingosinicella sp.]|nr:glycosyl hydrolase 108 family protein [Allosphingosinicella sp.]
MLARKGVNLETTPFVIGGLRGNFPKSMGPTAGNDRDTYDDGFFILTATFFRTYNGNSDPSGRKTGRASLVPGVYPVYKFDTHRGTKRQYPAICQRRGEVTVLRDGNPPRLDTGSHFGINIHEGGNWGTSSLGCQTLPNDQWEGFYADAKREAMAVYGDRWDDETITYVLFDMAAEDLVEASAQPGPAPAAPTTPLPAAPPAPAVQPASWWDETLKAAAELGATFGASAALAAPLVLPDPVAVAHAPQALLTPKGLFAGFIAAHEGGLSVHPNDNGNWYDPARYREQLPQRRGLGTLVGSKYGVTAYALIAYRLRKDMPLAEALRVTGETMAALDLDTAIDIGVELFYRQPGFEKLAWNRVTMSIVDKGWGSGPVTAIDMLQELIGASTVGGIGPETTGKYATFLGQHGEEGAARLWADKRKAFDLHVATNQGPSDPDRVFLNGWNNRTDSFLPGTPWWRQAGGEA